MTDKVIRFPVIEGGGGDSGEAEVMVLLGKASAKLSYFFED